MRLRLAIGRLSLVLAGPSAAAPTGGHVDAGQLGDPPASPATAIVREDGSEQTGGVIRVV